MVTKFDIGQSVKLVGSVRNIVIGTDGKTIYGIEITSLNDNKTKYLSIEEPLAWRFVRSRSMVSKIKVGSVVGLKGYVEEITCDSEETFYKVCFPQFDITMTCRDEDIYPVEDIIEENNKLKNELKKIGGDDLDRC